MVVNKNIRYISKMKKKPNREGYEAVPSPRQPTPGNQPYREGEYCM